MASLWMPGAIIVPGHPDKVGYPSGNSGPLRGTVVHSAEGWRAFMKVLVQGIQYRKSWCFSVLTDGEIWQHYPVDAWLWHSGDTDDDGGVKGNMELGSIEEEGLVGMPLTAEQTQSTVRVIRFQAEHFDRANAYARYPVMPADGWTLAEHTQISNTFTACPSDRVNWDDILALLQEDDEMVARIIKLKGDKVKTYLWRSGTPALLHMKSQAQRWETAKLFAISREAVTVDRATLDAL